MMRDLIDALQVATGHRFVDLALVLEATTHPSYAHEHPGVRHYQRLEFLGDAVVDLCATRLLIERYPNVPEGDLNDLRQRLVNTRALGVIGKALHLDRVVRLGGSEAGKPEVELRILGDVVEALFAALFQEVGLDACQRWADQHLAPLAESLRDDHEADVVKNAINRLQEYTQARWQIRPDYTYRWEGPDHDRRFLATVTISGEVLVEAKGRTKKAATKQAAHLALEILLRRDEAAT